MSGDVLAVVISAVALLALGFAYYMSQKGRCKYAIPIHVQSQPELCYVRCVKVHPLPSATRLHMARFPYGVTPAHSNSFVCWRSSNGPDYHMDDLKGTNVVE